MRRALILPVLLFFALLLAPGCDSGGDHIHCTLSTGTDTTPTAMTVQYRATATGDGVFSRITYRDVDGEKMINTPGANWSVSIDAPEGMMVSISGLGEVENGELEVAYSGTWAEGSGGGSISASDACAQETN